MLRREPRVVTRTRSGFALHLDADERAAVSRLLGELRELVTDGEPNDPIVARLFPVARLDDPEQEEEYQRLMRDELVESRTAAIDRVREVLGAGSGRKVALDEATLGDLMQALNGARLVLGTLLDVHEDDDPSEDELTPEHGLYMYLSWMLDGCVAAAMSPG